MSTMRKTCKRSPHTWRETTKEQTIQPDTSSYHLFEEIEYSRSYPGLKTVYRIHEITSRAYFPDCIVITHAYMKKHIHT